MAKFQVGDQVEFMDEALGGTVASVNGDTVEIETEEGFVISATADELVLIKDASLLDSAAPSEEVLRDKEKAEKKPQFKSARDDRPVFEVDLHSSALVKTTKGMDAYDILNLQLDTARSQLEFALKKRMQRMVFIHGVGEGVLKMELETLLSRYDEVKFYDADFKEYGFGATEVYIYQSKL